MPETQQAHPSREKLVAFGLGKLDPESQAELESHVAHCELCCQTLRSVPDDTLLNRIKGDDTCVFLPAANTEGAAAPAASSAEPELPPELADHPRYRIVRLLGSGGMGMVYQAEHRLMDRPVALKVISRNYTNNPTAVERFRQEVKAAARLSHVNIVAAYDAEQAGRFHFLVMEFVEGMSLSHWVERRGPLSVEAAAHYAWQTARGLQHAFEQGMVHRDIKPQNLMRTPRGGIKILDFGLARLAREHRPAAGPSAVAGSGPADITQAGTVLGTPDYIAPEQASDSSQVDIRADIYSLGCTLYFLLAGHPPFPRGSTTQKLTAHLDRQARSLSAIRSDLPADLVRVVERMMAKNPEHRYPTPADVVQALEPFRTAAAPRELVETPPPAPDLPPATAPLPPPAGLDALERAASAVNAPAAAAATRHDPLFAAPLAAASPLAPAWQAGKRRPRQRWRTLARRHRTALFAAGGLLAVLVVLSLTIPPAWRAIASAVQSRGAQSQAQSSAAQSPAATSSGTEGEAAAEPIEQAAIQPVTVPPAGKTGRVLIVMPPHYWSPDYVPVREVLESQGIEVKVASSTRDIATDSSQRGGPDVQPNLTIAEVNPDEFDAVVFIGGNDVWKLGQGRAAASAMMELLNAFDQDGKYLAALCQGIAIPATRGYFDGKRVACGQYTEIFASEFAAKEEHTTIQWDRVEPVILDGHILTGRDDTVAEPFARKLAELLRTKR